MVTDGRSHTGSPRMPLVWQSMDKIWVSHLISSKIAMVSNPLRFGVTLINTGLTNAAFFFKHQRITFAFKWCLVVIFCSCRSIALWGGQSHFKINVAGSVLLTNVLEKLYIQQMPMHRSFILDISNGRLTCILEMHACIFFIPLLRRRQNFASLYFL